MLRALSMLGVTICGISVSVLTAWLVMVLSRAVEIDLFSVMILFVVPVGAVVTGIVAASGYYFGSLFLHVGPSWSLMIQMVAVAGGTLVLIHYLQYTSLTLDDGRRVSALISFGQYLDVVLTTAHYRITRAQLESGQVGGFGYVLAAIQFIGFLVAGFAMFGHLTSKPTCSQCRKYVREIHGQEKQFHSFDDLAQYHDELFTMPVDSPEFAEKARAPYTAPVAPGTWKLSMKLMGCPGCKAQLFYNEMSVWDGSEWKSTDRLTRRIAIPQGIDLRGAFGAGQAAPV